MDSVIPGEVIEYVFGFPRFKLRLIDFYQETQMKDRIETIRFGCGCEAMPLDKSGTSWSLHHCSACLAPQKHDEKQPKTRMRAASPYRPISAIELEAIQHALRAREDSVLNTKGYDYTRGARDRLANFMSDSRELGISPEMVWAVHFRKQVAAVMTWVSTGRVESESLESRFVDIRNYCLLGMALHDANPKFVPRPKAGECVRCTEEELKCRS